MEEMKYKVSLVGDGGVGKTSLVKRFVHNQFDEKYIKTLGTNVYTKNVEILDGTKEIAINLQVWDIMGQRVFKSVIKSALSNAHGIILVADLSREETLRNLLYWVRIIYNHTSNVSFMFLGNKADIPEPTFGLSSLSSLASNFGSKAYLTSARSGTNVERAFSELSKEIYLKRYVPPKGAFDFNLEDIQIPPIISVEDKIINTFCKEIGDLEAGMPIVQSVFNELEVDFTDPTVEQLDEVIDILGAYLEKHKPQTAGAVVQNLKALLDQER